MQLDMEQLMPLSPAVDLNQTNAGCVTTERGQAPAYDRPDCWETPSRAGLDFFSELRTWRH